MARTLTVIGIPGLPIVRKGDDLGRLMLECLDRSGIDLESGDVLVVAQTLVSRSEGATVRLEEVSPSPRALEYSRITGKDPRLVEVILGQSRRVLWAERGFMICETLRGFVCANAGVDMSNNEEGWASTLPPDPDASAERIFSTIRKATGMHVPVIISDSEGRPFRRGAIGVAVGLFGLSPILRLAGVKDLFGRELETTEVALADLLCSASALVMGEAAEGLPAAIVRGVAAGGEGSSKDLIYQHDIFKEEFGRKPVDHPDNGSG